MASAADDEQKTENQKPDIETRTIYRPLVAVVCIAKKNNQDDKDAKIKDYQNALLAFNAHLNCDCIFQYEEKEQIEYINSFKSKKVKPWTDTEITSANYKTSWTEKEVFEFFDKCLLTIKNAKLGLYKYDSLFVVLTAFSTEMKPMEPNETYSSQIEVSDGKKIELRKIFENVNKDKFMKIFGYEDDDEDEFIRYFMIDRYFHVASKYDAMLNNEDKDKKKKMKEIKMDLDKHGAFFQFHSHTGPLAITNASKEGGLLSRAIKKNFQSDPHEFIKRGQFDDDDLVIEKCRIGDYMLRMAYTMMDEEAADEKAHVMPVFPPASARDGFKIQVEMEFVRKDWRKVS